MQRDEPLGRCQLRVRVATVVVPDVGVALDEEHRHVLVHVLPVGKVVVHSRHHDRGLDAPVATARVRDQPVDGHAAERHARHADLVVVHIELVGPVEDLVEHEPGVVRLLGDLTRQRLAPRRPSSSSGTSARRRRSRRRPRRRATARAGSDHRRRRGSPTAAAASTSFPRGAYLGHEGSAAAVDTVRERVVDASHTRGGLRLGRPRDRTIATRCCPRRDRRPRHRDDSDDEHQGNHHRVHQPTVAIGR